MSARREQGSAMTQVIYTIKEREGRWTMVVNAHEFGHFANREDALKMAIETAREAGRFNAGGTKVVVESADAGPETVWSCGEHAGR
jgi:hypothetical protein